MIRLLTAVLLACVAFLHAQTTSGTLTGSETWSGTVDITGDVIVDGTLIIEPGTTVRFATTNDNVVMGAPSQIRVVVMPAGTLLAEGTVEERIVFTTVSTESYWNKRGMIQVIANGRRSHISYCDFNYMKVGVNVESPAGVDGESYVRVGNCRFNDCSSAGVGVHEGDSVSIIKCSFYDCSKAVATYSAGYIHLYNSKIRHCGNGIVASGDDGEENVVDVDRCVFYDVDYMYGGTSPQWGMMYTFVFTGDTDVRILNSVFGPSGGGPASFYYINGAGPNNGIVVKNCCYIGIPGSYIPYGDSTGGCFIDDPLFVNPQDGDFRLQPGSPCIGTAEDGTDIGLLCSGDDGWCNADAAVVRYIRPTSLMLTSEDEFDIMGEFINDNVGQYQITLQVGPDGVLRKRMMLE